MGINDDFVNPLVTDILTQVAGNFFEARRLLDHKIDLFYDYVESLKVATGRVEDQAAFLNYLLIDETEAIAFYKNLSIPAEPFLVGEQPTGRARPFRLPAALTMSGRYQKLFEWAVEALRTACDVYLKGEKRDAGPQPKTEEKANVYFNLLYQMHTLINEDIEKINCYLSPSCTLQFARSFDMETSDKEKTFGRTAPDLTSLDEKLRYQPICFGSLKIKKFPELPQDSKTKAIIKSTVRRVYRTKRSLVKDRLAALLD